jgi:predicted RNA polymerase sigma factor
MLMQNIHWKPIATRHIRRPKVRWEEDVKNNLKATKVQNWRRRRRRRRRKEEEEEKEKEEEEEEEKNAKHTNFAHYNTQLMELTTVTPHAYPAVPFISAVSCSYS